MALEKDQGQSRRMASVDQTEAGYGVSRHVIDVGGQSAVGLGAMGLEGDGLNAASGGNLI